MLELVLDVDDRSAKWQYELYQTMSNVSVIFTNHARQRLQERQLSENWVRQTVQQPDSRSRGKQSGTTEFVKRFGTSTVSVVASTKMPGEWVVVSAWIDPPVPGTRDDRRKQRYLAYRRAGFWGKTWRLVLKQLGLWDF